MAAFWHCSVALEVMTGRERWRLRRTHCLTRSLIMWAMAAMTDRQPILGSGMGVDSGPPATAVLQGTWGDVRQQHARGQVTASAMCSIWVKSVDQQYSITSSAPTSPKAVTACRIASDVVSIFSTTLSL